MQSFLIAATTGILHAYRLISQLQTNLTSVSTDIFILRNNVPYRQQIFLIITIHTNLARTYTRWTHYDIHAVFHGLLHQREIKRLKVILQASLTEMGDVCLAFHYLSYRVYSLVFSVLRESSSSNTIVIGPCWFQMQAEYITFGLLQSSKQFLEIVKTTLTSCIIITPAPATVIKPSTWGIHHTV